MYVVYVCITWDIAYRCSASKESRWATANVYPGLASLGWQLGPPTVSTFQTSRIRIDAIMPLPVCLSRSGTRGSNQMRGSGLEKMGGEREGAEKNGHMKKTREEQVGR
jgi:hypothetical protein